MARVAIVTDTISCLPPELITENDIRVLPLGLVINGQPYRDQMDITPAEFWQRFPEIKQFSTSSVSVDDFVSAFTELSRSTDSIVSIVVSRKLTAVHEAALLARKMVQEKNPDLKIEIVDSKTATGALGFIVLEAARAAREGQSLEEVVRVAESMVDRVKFLVGMDTLKYLMKSGRAPRTAMIGELLQVKPIIGMVSGTGEVENLGRVRTKGKCLLKLADMVRDYADTSRPLHLNVHYTDRIEDGEELKALITARYRCVEQYLTPYTPVMAGHTGPVVAAAFYA